MGARRAWWGRAAVLVLGLTGATARALDGDIVWSEVGGVGAPPDTWTGGRRGWFDQPNPEAQERYARLAAELVSAATPLPGGVAATLGDAGFQVSLGTDLAFVNRQQTLSTGVRADIWPTQGDQTGALVVPTLRVRKGLPFSLQLGTDVSWLFDSSMASVSGSVQWSLFEGYDPVPQVALRAFGTGLVGTTPLQAGSVGWGVSVGDQFTLDSSAVLSLYGGFQQVGIGAYTSSFDRDPANEPSDGVAGPLDDDRPYAPLPLVEKGTMSLATSLYRYSGGVQLRWTALVLGLEAGYTEGRNRIGGNDVRGDNRQFDTGLWQTSLRLGVAY